LSPKEQEHEAIRQVLTSWSEVVRRKDYDGILKHHSPDMQMFDVTPPFQSAGIDAYRRTWDLFFGWMAGPPRFELSDVRITAGRGVAFVTAHGKCFGPNESGSAEELDFPLSVGLRKTAGQWIVEHEHH